MTGGWKICPACGTHYRTLASACSKECLVAAPMSVRRCEVCRIVHPVTGLTLTLTRGMWRCRDEHACAARAIAQTSDADRAAMKAGLEESWLSLQADGWRWPRAD